MITFVVSESMEEVFAHEDECPFVIFVVLGDEIESVELLIRHCLVKNPGTC